jgi:hypothetical protein
MKDSSDSRDCKDCKDGEAPVPAVSPPGPL